VERSGGSAIRIDRVRRGLEFDPGAGRLWSTEMGPRGGDEPNLLVAGKNYGWPLCSKGMDYDGTPVDGVSVPSEIERRPGVSVELDPVAQYDPFGDERRGAYGRQALFFCGFRHCVVPITRNPLGGSACPTGGSVSDEASAPS